MRSLIARLRSLWGGLRRRDQVEAEMAEEFRVHLEMRTEDLVRSGLSPADAARQARLEFGNSAHYRDEARASRGLHAFDEIRFSWLDLKLGFRMLVRYPGLTLVAGMAMAFGIWVGAGTFEVAMQVLRPDLPLPQGERIVGFQLWNTRTSEEARPTTADLLLWRERVTSVEQLGGYRSIRRNLVLGQEGGEPATIAEMSAAGFQVARVPPLLGRYLVEADEQPGVAAVAVIGYDLWQARFASDPTVVGRSIWVGGRLVEVVGVMPEGFAFPLNHGFWVPLHLDPHGEEVVHGTFARLVEGATAARAEAELAPLLAAMTDQDPEQYQFLEPLVLPYARAAFMIVPPRLRARLAMGVASTNLVPLLLLLIICANVALLTFARAASREAELVVRTALGASRRRIVVQLFAEALVLGGIATLVGLAGARFAVAWVVRVVEGLTGEQLPFWFRPDLSATTVVYAAILTLLGALLAGVLPALKVTRGTGARLKEMTAGGGGMKFGRFWTAVIVTQVAITVVFPAVAFFTQREGAGVTGADLGIRSEQYITAALRLERESGEGAEADTGAVFAARFANVRAELEDRLRAEPGILGVTYSSRLPRTYHGWNQIEMDAGAVEPMDERGHRIASATVELDYFDVLGVRVLAGRGFHSGDQAEDARAVIVNEAFIGQVLGGRNPLGRRLRYVATESNREPRDDGPWFEVVGVVQDLGTRTGYGEAGVYHPAGRGPAEPIQLLAHVGGPPEHFGPVLRRQAFLADPGLAVEDPAPLDGLLQADVEFYRFWSLLATGVSCIALLLALAGVYSVMAYTVSRRTREIGIRLALGASARQVARSVLARPLAQVGLGVFMGTALVALGPFVLESSPLLEEWVRKGLAVGGYAILMTAVCLLACVVPTRRALRVQPTEALRAET